MERNNVIDLKERLTLRAEDVAVRWSGEYLVNQLTRESNGKGKRMGAEENIHLTGVGQKARKAGNDRGRPNLSDAPKEKGVHVQRLKEVLAGLADLNRPDLESLFERARRYRL